MIGTLAMTVVGVLIALAFGAGFLARRRQESRARLLEVLARAVTRGRPLPPLTARIACELRGSVRRRVDILTRQLSAGFGLSDSFATAGDLLPWRDVEAIRCAEDGPALAPVLEELARDAGRGLMVRHRIGLALAYPALLVPLLALSWWQVSSLTRALPIPDLPSLDIGAVLSSLPFLGFAVLGTFVLLFSPSFSWLKPRRISFISKTAAEARLYRLAAVHLDTGRTLPDALRHAAVGAGRRSVQLRAEDAAARIASGDTLRDVWPWFPGAAASLAGRLRRMADHRRERQRARTERRFALLHPLTVIAFAALTFVEFRVLVEIFEQGRKAALPW